MKTVSICTILVVLFLPRPLTGSDRITDPEIAKGVTKVLQADRRVGHVRVEVDAAKGWVRLQGKVDNLADKFRIEQLAKKVQGVRGVTNQMRLESPLRADREIQEDVRRRLSQSSVVRAHDLQVEVQHGVVRLTGRVDTWAQSREAQLTAKDVRGVRLVQSQLVVSVVETSPLSDARIQADVQGHLDRDVYLAEFPLDVSVMGAVVTLKGEVSSLFQKERAHQEARIVAGVKAVENKLVLRPWRHFDTNFAPPTDSELDQLLRRELESDPRIESSQISVAASQGTVVLRGSVATFFERQIAERMARAVVGVVRVDNQLLVAAQTREDAEVQKDIEAELASDSLLAGQSVSVAVNQGAVMLSGEVKDFNSKAGAIRLASRVRGVRSVAGELKVASSIRLSDDTITHLVTDRLKVNWATRPIVDRINVRTEDRVVTLTGAVFTWAQRAEAGRAARFTDGVRGVDNELTVIGHATGTNEKE